MILYHGSNIIVEKPQLIPQNSAHALFEMLQEELSTGKITYPEEA